MMAKTGGKAENGSMELSCLILFYRRRMVEPGIKLTCKFTETDELAVLPRAEQQDNENKVIIYAENTRESTKMHARCIVLRGQ